jgi:hypothetical protein
MPHWKNTPIIEHGFDRLEIWLDRSEYPGQLDTLKAHCRVVKHIVGDMPHNPRWKSKLEIFQPTSEFLQELRKALGGTVNAHLAYVEVALDLIPKSAKVTKKLEAAFLQSAVPKHHRRPARLVKGTTWYFDQRFNGKGERRARVLVAYADRPSKLNNRRHWKKGLPCLHIEMRISGPKALELVGIHAIDDLIQFQHSSFWKNHIELYQLPNKTQLGQLVGKMQGKDRKVGDRALTKRATQWMQENTTPETGQFVLYNALRGLNRRALNSHRVTFKQWLADAVSSGLKEAR